MFHQSFSIFSIEEMLAFDATPVVISVVSAKGLRGAGGLEGIGENGLERGEGGVVELDWILLP